MNIKKYLPQTEMIIHYATNETIIIKPFMKSIHLLSLASLLLLLSCNRTDFSNAESVAINYNALSWKTDKTELYNEYLSSKSKELITLDEYLNFVKDDSLSLKKLLEQKIHNCQIDANNPTYRRFRIDETYTYKNNTIHNRYYQTIIL